MTTVGKGSAVVIHSAGSLSQSRWLVKSDVIFERANRKARKEGILAVCFQVGMRRGPHLCGRGVALAGAADVNGLRLFEFGVSAGAHQSLDTRRLG